MAALRLALAVFVVMLAVINVTEGMRGSGPKKCCSVFNDKPMQKSRVMGYTKTSQRCANPAVLFTTTTGRRVCARPSAAWVKELITYLDAKPVPGETSNV
ncbi:C-C motif chemokine 4 [Nibea albiflora]|uniref:C-C motif chemokine 4 n=1 Tax=Nibea albiflora TaxID=240163 RepID=A0ACB7FGB0_NIBAL|nr:C-C motif chemokine 4 [Nibea albiflora]